MPKQVWISPFVFIIACPMVAALILWIVIRVVRKANEKISHAKSETVRATVKADANEMMARNEHRRYEEASRLTEKALTQTGEAMRVASRVKDVAAQMPTLHKISEQMDAMIGYLADEITQPHGRHRHITQDEEQKS